ncbi:MAG: carbohydrate kinase family protein [Hyphomicrobiales bacterium]
MSHYNLIGIGGAHIDRIGRTDGEHRPSTSNPGSLRESVGGGMFNALRVTALRQAGSIALISERGADSAGTLVAQAIEEAGFTDLSGVSRNSASATYTAILDQNGELITALADMAIYGDALTGHLRQRSIVTAISSASAILMDANLTESALQTVVGAAHGPVFAIAVSAAKAARLIPSASAIDVIFMNHHEARLLSGQEDIHLAARHCVKAVGFNKCVVTQGNRPVLVVQGDELWSIEVPTAEVIDVTGAGDALCGGTIAALLRQPNVPLPQAVREGIACSALTLGSPGPISEKIASNAFPDILAKVSAPTLMPTRNA